MNAICSRAIGRDSKSTMDAICRVREHLLTNISAGKPKLDALSTLADLFEKTCQPGWDGYDGTAVTWEAYAATKRFIEMLPTSLPMPEIAADPDGHISLEWYINRERMFWVSIGPHDFLHYVGAFRTATTRGGEAFLDEIPQAVIIGIKRVYI